MRHSNNIWKRQERSKQPYYRKAERMFKRSLNVQLKPVIDYLNEVGDLVDYDKVRLLIKEAPILDSMEYVYTTAGSDFAEKIYSQYADAEGLRSQFDRFMVDLVRNTSATKVTAITDVTRRDAINVIRKSLSGDLSDGEGRIGYRLSQDLEKAGAKISKWRARVIARTEVNGAFNAGQDFGMQKMSQDLGLEYTKTWLATADNRTRDAHYNMNGKTIPREASFIVGGEEMDRPHAIGASAANVVNCRCGLTYEII